MNVQKSYLSNIIKSLLFLSILLSGANAISLVSADSGKNTEDTLLPKARWVVALDGSGHFQSIQEAVDHAQTGDTVWIKRGSYHEDVTVHSKERIQVIGEGRDLVLITGLERVGTFHIGKWPYGATNVVIQGMTIEQHGGLGLGIFNGEGVVLRQLRVKGMVFGQQVKGVTIEDCVVGGSETSGIAFADSHATLVRNFIHDNDHGVAVGGTSNVHIQNNVIVRSLYEGVLVTGKAEAAVVSNTLFGNGGGVYFKDETTGDLRGNIIENTKVAAKFSPKSHIRMSVNALFNNSKDYLVGGDDPPASFQVERKADLHVDPKFVAPEKEDFRLQPDSSLIKQGGFPYLGALPPIK